MENRIKSSEIVTDQPPISRTVLLDAAVSPMKQTSRVEVRRITMLPGFAAGFHVHNGPVFGSIVEGSVDFQLEGQSATLLKAGDVFHEPEGVPVRFDATDEGATFLAYFLLNDGQEPEISMVEG
jgi:quercetin dioxygenase-like cupin family protein